MAASVEKKTVMTTFLRNLRSSRPEMFFKIAVLKYLRKLPRKHPWWSVFVSKIKRNTTTDVFLEFFSNFSKQLPCCTLPGGCFSNS